MESKKISFFLHFPLGEENSNIYIKENFGNYFCELSNFFSISIVGTKTSRSFYHTRILKSNVNAFLVKNKSRLYPIQKFLLLYNQVYKSDFCFLFMPCMSSVIVGLFCVLLKKPFATYFGSNWYDLTLSYNNKKYFQAKINKKFSNFLSKKSRFSLYAGQSLLDSHKGRNKYLTQPIFNLTPKSIFIRTNYRDLFSSTEINILYVGALTKNKGVEYLVDAIEILKNKKVFLNIIGDGLEMQNLIDKTVKLKLESQISFLGYIENGDSLCDFYRKSDIFILPSFSEGFPRVLYEAAGNGCTIITTPVNSIPTLFKDYHNCLYIEPGNPEDIAKTINKVINSRGLNEVLSKNAYDVIKNLLTIKASEQHSNLIRKYLY